MDSKIGTLGFLGFGNMGKAIAKGVVAAGIVPASGILIKDPGLPADFAASLAGQGYQFAESEADLFSRSSVVVIAVKPQTAKAERDNWKALFASLNGSGKTYVSIMAGIKAPWLREIAPQGSVVVRVMPNLGLSVGQGATAIATEAASEESLRIVESIFQSCGTTVRVTEDQMDAVTAVSGSGPMYVFEFVEAMTAAGEKAGLSREVAYELVQQTVRGSLELLKPVDGVPSATPDEWSARVRSPGGTTAAAQDLLRAEGFRDMLGRAVLAAKKRSVELS
ncbi:MAG: pyrroline-5-carboxylate reductase [Fibrobacteria bacterium]|jgi:pyrroline-5-carboxylate reductase|nr:pyrroline-5-carboxylate reductase [Fibrobacteria bacterium]